jgi:hypothetical protein
MRTSSNDVRDGWAARALSRCVSHRVHALGLCGCRPTTGTADSGPCRLQGEVYFHRAVTPLMAAARMDHWSAVYRLLDGGGRPLDANELLRRLRLRPTDLLDAGRYGELSTYYSTGVTYGRLRLVFALTGVEIGTSRREAAMSSLLETAVYDGSRGESAALLVSAGANPDYRFCPGSTRPRSPNDLRCTPEAGTTLQMFAASCGYARLERVVALRGDPTLVDWEGRTASDYRRSRPVISCGGGTLW